MIIGCYDMHLYCSNDPIDGGDIEHPYRYLPFYYSGQTLGQCKRQARKQGWLFKKDGRTICPLCRKNKTQ